jgi:hypothetical protein
MSVGIDIPHEDRPAKVSSVRRTIAVVDGIPIYETVYTGIAGLPEPETGTFYVVSAVVLNYVREFLPHRKDIIAPSGAIKNANNNTIGCTAFRING